MTYHLIKSRMDPKEKLCNDLDYIYSKMEWHKCPISEELNDLKKEMKKSIRELKLAN